MFSTRFRFATKTSSHPSTWVHQENKQYDVAQGKSDFWKVGRAGTEQEQGFKCS